MKREKDYIIIFSYYINMRRSRSASRTRSRTQRRANKGGRKTRRTGKKVGRRSLHKQGGGGGYWGNTPPAEIQADRAWG